MRMVKKKENTVNWHIYYWWCEQISSCAIDALLNGKWVKKAVTTAVTCFHNKAISSVKRNYSQLNFMDENIQKVRKRRIRKTGKISCFSLSLLLGTTKENLLKWCFALLNHLLLKCNLLKWFKCHHHKLISLFK